MVKVILSFETKHFKRVSNLMILLCRKSTFKKLDLDDQKLLFDCANAFDEYREAKFDGIRWASSDEVQITNFDGYTGTAGKEFRK